MPVMDGFAFCRECKKDQRLCKVPFIFYTATYTDERDRDFALSLGADKFIVKPEEPEAFIKTVQGVIHQVQSLPGAAKRVLPETAQEGEAGYLKQYNQVLVHRLEAKMEQLEQTNRELERDVIERKKTGEALFQEHKQFQELFNNMSSGVAIYEAKDNGEDFIFKDINKAGERFGKLSREQIIGKSVLQVFPGIRELGIFEVFQKVWKTGESQRHPMSLYQDARISQWVENYVYKLPSGEIVAVYDDITERKQAEEKINESEIRYREFFTTSRDCVFITSVEGKWIDFNDVALEMFGYGSREELSSVSIGSLYVDSQDRSTLLALIEQQGYVKEYPVQLKRKDGRVIDVLITSAFREKTDNFGKEYYGTIRDVTEYKQYVDALAYKTMLLEANSQTTIDGVLAVDSEGRVILANERLGELWRIPKHVLGTKDDTSILEYVVSQLQDPAEFRRKVSWLYEHRNEKSRDEIELTEGRYFDRYSSPLWGADGKYYGRIWYFRDITERKKMEDELRKRLQELEVFYKASVGREERIIELKKEIAMLRMELGK
jgi:PAS domain S-box-containing protein